MKSPYSRPATEAEKAVIATATELFNAGKIEEAFFTLRSVAHVDMMSPGPYESVEDVWQWLQVDNRAIKMMTWLAQYIKSQENKKPL